MRNLSSSTTIEPNEALMKVARLAIRLLLTLHILVLLIILILPEIPRQITVPVIIRRGRGEAIHHQIQPIQLHGSGVVFGVGDGKGHEFGRVGLWGGVVVVPHEGVVLPVDVDV